MLPILISHFGSISYETDMISARHLMDSFRSSALFQQLGLGIQLGLRT
jgi:hypothetical protein